LEGLRFDVVIGLYTIAMNFMEHQESQSQSLAMLYGSTPQLSMITSSPMSDIETDNSGTSTPKSIPSIQPLGHDWGHSGRASIVRNKSCNK
jgi:hypothetical protein